MLVKQLTSVQQGSCNIPHNRYDSKQTTLFQHCRIYSIVGCGLQRFFSHHFVQPIVKGSLHFLFVYIIKR